SAGVAEPAVCRAQPAILVDSIFDQRLVPKFGEFLFPAVINWLGHLWKPIVFLGVSYQCVVKRMEVALALTAFRSCLNFGKAETEHHGRQDGDDRNGDEQFDQRPAVDSWVAGRNPGVGPRAHPAPATIKRT